jgi:hypothetical protein
MFSYSRSPCRLVAAIATSWLLLGSSSHALPPRRTEKEAHDYYLGTGIYDMYVVSLSPFSAIFLFPSIIPLLHWKSHRQILFVFDFIYT